MRILHTSDWHLGKLMNGISLLDDQKVFLKQILNQLTKAESENDPYSAIVVAGDIYDRSIPPEEATEILSTFLSDFSDNFPDVHLFMISGNHDSASRLSFASSFFNKHKIHIVTNTRKITEPIILDNVAFYQLPYLYPLSLKNRKNPEVLLRKQQELYDEACAEIYEVHNQKYKDMAAILVAHPFALGEIKVGSERSNVGTAEQVDINTFKNFTYCAFGHIHGYHVCDSEKRCFYSGAPLAYHVDDCYDTFMLDVKIDGNNKPEVSKIPFEPLHPLVLLEGKCNEFLDGDKKWKDYKEYYVFIVLTDDVAVPNAHVRLKEVFPNLMNVKLKDRIYGGTKASILQRKEAIESKDIVKIFGQFILDVEGKEPENKELYEQEIKLLKEIAESTKWGENL